MSNQKPTTGPSPEHELGVEDRFNVQIAVLECVLSRVAEIDYRDLSGSADAQLVLRQAIDALELIRDEVSQLEFLMARAREAVNG